MRFSFGRVLMYDRSVAAGTLAPADSLTRLSRNQPSSVTPGPLPHEPAPLKGMSGSRLSHIRESWELSTSPRKVCEHWSKRISRAVRKNQVYRHGLDGAQRCRQL